MPDGIYGGVLVPDRPPEMAGGSVPVSYGTCCLVRSNGLEDQLVWGPSPNTGSGLFLWCRDPDGKFYSPLVHCLWQFGLEPGPVPPVPPPPLPALPLPPPPQQNAILSALGSAVRFSQPKMPRFPWRTYTAIPGRTAFLQPAPKTMASTGV